MQGVQRKAQELEKKTREANKKKQELDRELETLRSFKELNKQRAAVHSS